MELQGARLPPGNRSTRLAGDRGLRMEQLAAGNRQHAGEHYLVVQQ
jgi:hypothetical protein